MNLQHDRISALCEAMKLDAVARDWSTIAQRAADTDVSFADFLEQLLKCEQVNRDERRREMLLKLATLPAVKTLEQYDFNFASVHHGRRSRSWQRCHSSSVPRT